MLRGVLRQVVGVTLLVSLVTGNPHPQEYFKSPGGDFFPGFTISQNMSPPKPVGVQFKTIRLGENNEDADAVTLTGASFPGFTIQQNIQYFSHFDKLKSIKESEGFSENSETEPKETPSTNSEKEPQISLVNSEKKPESPASTNSEKKPETPASTNSEKDLLSFPSDNDKKTPLPTDNSFYYPYDVKRTVPTMGPNFPGFTITQNANPSRSQMILTAPPQWIDLTNTFPTLGFFNKNQKPNLKPELISQPHIPYLFPYLFPGQRFPGFTVGQNIKLQMTPVQTLTKNLNDPKSIEGISRPLTLEESAEAYSSSLLNDDHPWKEKEDLLKPIKETMELLSNNRNSSSNNKNSSSNVIVNLSTNINVNQHTDQGNKSSGTFQSEKPTPLKEFDIASPEAGKVTIIYRKPNPEAVTAELIKYLEQSLGQFKNFSQEDGLNSISNQSGTEPEIAFSKTEEEKTIPTLPVAVEAIVASPSSDKNFTILLPALATTPTSNKTVSKIKPKAPTRPRPAYGIQSNKNKEEVATVNSPPKPIASILNPLGMLPSWMVSPPKWSSFSSMVQRFTNSSNRGHNNSENSSSSSASLRLEMETDCTPEEIPEDAKGMCPTQEDGASCSSFCTSNNFHGGFCYEAHRCVCHVDVEKKIGLIFKKSEPLRPELRSDSKEEEKGCVQQCMRAGALTGFCGSGCFCGIPWQDGTLIL